MRFEILIAQEKWETHNVRNAGQIHWNQTNTIVFLLRSFAYQDHLSFLVDASEKKETPAMYQIGNDYPWPKKYVL